MQHIRSAPLLR